MSPSVRSFGVLRQFHDRNRRRAGVPRGRVRHHQPRDACRQGAPHAPRPSDEIPPVCARARLTIGRLPATDAPSLLKEVSALQRDVAVVRAFAPLPRRLSPAAPTTGYEDVKRVALARLLVDVPSIQVDWSLYGRKLAQVALTVGADDVDAVSADDALSEGRRRAPLEEILRNIRAAGLEPIERNGRFESIAR